MPSNFEVICSQPNPSETTDQMCLNWSSYLKTFGEGGYALPIEEPSIHPVRSSHEAQALTQQWKTFEGAQAVASGDFHCWDAQAFRNSNFHNDQTYRLLSGEGPLEMPTSYAEVSSEGWHILATGGPLGLNPISHLSTNVQKASANMGGMNTSHGSNGEMLVMFLGVVVVFAFFKNLTFR